MLKTITIMLLALVAVSCAHVREPASVSPTEQEQIERFEFYRLQMGAEM